MFKEDQDMDIKVNKILEQLNNHDDTKSHSRHIHLKQAKDIGLNIKVIEQDFDKDFQDLVLTVHHAFMHTFSNSNAIKIIENQIENAEDLKIYDVDGYRFQANLSSENEWVFTR